MREFKAENAKPNPKSTINSYRSFGYTLSTAIADFITSTICQNGRSNKSKNIFNSIIAKLC